MRKPLMTVLAAIVAAMVVNPDTSACGGRRRSPCCPPCCQCCLIPYYGYSRMPLGGERLNLHAEAAPPHVISTKAFTTPGGRTYRIRTLDSQDTHEVSQFSGLPEISIESAGDDFIGHDRKASKTSVATAPNEPLTDLADLLANLPKTDAAMADDDRITKAANNKRVPAENHNVQVRALLYASSRERDNDFHLILGTSDAAQTGDFINAEVSGLPTTGAFRAPLKQVRDDFKSFFGANLPGRSYDIYDRPIPVIVSGSLFWDIDHAPGVVGPPGYRPQTSWEIHPITHITLDAEE
jgi:hypothetical protein